MAFLALTATAGDAVAQREQGSPAPEPVVGRMDSVTARRIADLPAWKRITLGSYQSVTALRVALDAARVRVGEMADEILGRPAFHFSKTMLEVDLVVVRVSELGFDQATSLGEIHRRAVGLGLELCPSEVAPLLRLHYTNQPLGELLNIAMSPIAAYGGDPVALSVANAGTGLLLIGGEGRPDLLMNERAQFVFVRMQRIALPALR